MKISLLDPGTIRESQVLCLTGNFNASSVGTLGLSSSRRRIVGGRNGLLSFFLLTSALYGLEDIWQVLPLLNARTNHPKALNFSHKSIQFSPSEDNNSKNWETPRLLFRQVFKLRVWGTQRLTENEFINVNRNEEGKGKTQASPQAPHRDEWKSQANFQIWDSQS